MVFVLRHLIAPYVRWFVRYWFVFALVWIEIGSGLPACSVLKTQLRRICFLVRILLHFLMVLWSLSLLWEWTGNKVACHIPPLPWLSPPSWSNIAGSPIHFPLWRLSIYLENLSLISLYSSVPCIPVHNSHTSLLLCTGLLYDCDDDTRNTASIRTVIRLACSGIPPPVGSDFYRLSVWYSLV